MGSQARHSLDEEVLKARMPNKSHSSSAELMNEMDPKASLGIDPKTQQEAARLAGQHCPDTVNQIRLTILRSNC